MAPRKTLGKDDEVRFFYDHGVHIPTRRLVIESVQVDPEYGESGVDAHTWSRLEKGLTILENWPVAAEQNDTITIVANNPGGDEYHMFAMYDRIRACPRRVVMELGGYVVSAMSVIAQAADLRRIHKNATMMIHHGTVEFSGHTKNLQSWAQESKRIEERLYDIYLERIAKKKPEVGRAKLKAELKRKMNFDWWISADEAVRLGLADEIIPYPQSQ